MRQDKKILFSIYYHNIFEYPLTSEELTHWRPGEKLVKNPKSLQAIIEKDGLFFFKGKERLIAERKKREKISKKKIELAKRGAKIISKIPTVKMVGLTGALAMTNAKENSDIDLFIITKEKTLWTSRAIAILLLDILKVPRNAGGRVEKDKLCLNMWLDEEDLVWDKMDRNFYTAHEIAQIIPLINKDGTYEKFINKNRWIGDFWPNTAKMLSPKEIRNLNKKQKKNIVFQYLYGLISNFFEPIAFIFQYLYMKRKITREIVTRTRAIFHPRDWGKIVLSELNKL